MGPFSTRYFLSVQNREFFYTPPVFNASFGVTPWEFQRLVLRKIELWGCQTVKEFWRYFSHFDSVWLIDSQADGRTKLLALHADAR